MTPTRLVLVLLGCASLAACGSRGDVVSQASPASVSTEPAYTPSVAAATVDVKAADSCSAQRKGDIDANEHGVQLSTGLSHATRWIKMSAPPTYVGTFEHDPSFSSLSIDVAASLGYEFASEVTGRIVEPTASDVPGEPYFAADDVAGRLASIRLEEGDFLLLAIGRSSTYSAWYIYRSFAVASDGIAWVVDDCGQAQTEQLRRITGVVAESTGFVGSDLDLLLGLSHSYLERLEFGDTESSGTESDDAGSPQPEIIGQGDSPVHLTIKTQKDYPLVFVCLALGDDGVCLASDANRGEPYEYVIALDSESIQATRVFITPDGTEASASQFFELDATSSSIEFVVGPSGHVDTNLQSVRK